MKRFTKILLSLAIIVATCVISTESKAQFTNASLSKLLTSAGADTITGTIGLYPASIAVSVTAVMTPVSGTTGRIVLQASNKGYTWTPIDSVTVNFTAANGAYGGSPYEWTFNHVSTPTKLDKPDFLMYRWKWYQTAGSVSAAKGFGLIRTTGGK